MMTCSKRLIALLLVLSLSKDLAAGLAGDALLPAGAATFGEQDAALVVDPAFGEATRLVGAHRCAPCHPNSPCRMVRADHPSSAFKEGGLASIENGSRGSGPPLHVAWNRFAEQALILPLAFDRRHNRPAAVRVARRAVHCYSQETQRIFVNNLRETASAAGLFAVSAGVFTARIAVIQLRDMGMIAPDAVLITGSVGTVVSALGRAFFRRRASTAESDLNILSQKYFLNALTQGMKTMWDWILDGQAHTFDREKTGDHALWELLEQLDRPGLAALARADREEEHHKRGRGETLAKLLAMWDVWTWQFHRTKRGDDSLRMELFQLITGRKRWYAEEPPASAVRVVWPEDLLMPPSPAVPGATPPLIDYALDRLYAIVASHPVGTVETRADALATIHGLRRDYRLVSPDKLEQLRDRLRAELAWLLSAIGERGNARTGTETLVLWLLGTFHQFTRLRGLLHAVNRPETPIPPEDLLFATLADGRPAVRYHVPGGGILELSLPDVTRTAEVGFRALSEMDLLLAQRLFMAIWVGRQLAGARKTNALPPDLQVSGTAVQLRPEELFQYYEAMLWAVEERLAIVADDQTAAQTRQELTAGEVPEATELLARNLALLLKEQSPFTIVLIHRHALGFQIEFDCPTGPANPPTRELWEASLYFLNRLEPQLPPDRTLLLRRDFAAIVPRSATEGRWVHLWGKRGEFRLEPGIKERPTWLQDLQWVRAESVTDFKRGVLEEIPALTQTLRDFLAVSGARRPPRYDSDTQTEFAVGFLRSARKHLAWAISFGAWLKNPEFSDDHVLRGALINLVSDRQAWPRSEKAPLIAEEQPVSAGWKYALAAWHWLRSRGVMPWREAKARGAALAVSEKFAVKWIPWLELPLMPGLPYFLMGLGWNFLPAITLGAVLAALFHGRQTLKQFAVRTVGAWGINFAASALFLVDLHVGHNHEIAGSLVSAFQNPFDWGHAIFLLVSLFGVAPSAHTAWNEHVDPKYWLSTAPLRGSA